MSLKKLCTAVLICAVCLPAFADDDYDDDDYRPRRTQTATPAKHKSSNATISRQQAIAIATKRVGGRAIGVDYDAYDDDRGVPTYDVEVLSGRTKHEVKINASTGKIIHVKRDND